MINGVHNYKNKTQTTKSFGLFDLIEKYLIIWFYNTIKKIKKKKNKWIVLCLEIGTVLLYLMQNH